MKSAQKRKRHPTTQTDFLVLLARRPHVQNRSFLFLCHQKTSSRLVAARGGKKGRIRLFDGDAVLAPEKELGAAVDINRHLRDRQAPCLFIPTVDGTIPIGFQFALFWSTLTHSEHRHRLPDGARFAFC